MHPILLIIGIAIILPVIAGLIYAMYMSTKDSEDHVGHIITAIIITVLAMALFGLC